MTFAYSQRRILRSVLFFGVASSARHFYFIYLLGGKARLGNGFTVFREAIVKALRVADGNNVANLVKIEFRIKSIGANGALLVMQLTVTAVKHKAVGGVLQSSLSNHIDTLVIRKDANINRAIKAVFAAFDFLFDLFPLPIKPIGNMVYYGITVLCLKLAEGRKLVRFSAGVANELRTLALRFTLCSAGGTLIEYSFKSVCTEGLVYLDSVFLLPLKTVKAEGIVKYLIYLGKGFGLQLLRC